MALRINTNISALNAHANLKKTDAGLSKSLERLSTGLRINRSADDAAGLSIANVLKSQSVGIGQAVKNANDGISIVQIADAALDETVNILNTIKTKAIQAAEDGQTLASRKALQADIDKLIAELDDIAQNTSFSGQKLLSGVFTNKQFQVGAFSGETVSVSIGSTESTKIGHVTTGLLTPNSTGEVRLSIYSNYKNEFVDIESITLAYDNSAEHGMGALADAINRVSADTGVTAQASVSVTSNSAVAAGSTGSDFAINGVTIGALTVLANDADGSLVNAINQKTSQHGVVASVDESGYLTLTSTDGRAIKVTGDTGTVLLGSDLTTLGEIKLFQQGANEIIINDAVDKVSLNLTGSGTFQLDNTATTVVDSIISANSVIGSDSVLKAGSEIGFTLSDTNLAANVTTTQDSTLVAGSVLGSDSVIKASSVLGGDLNTQTAVTTTADSLLKTGTVLASNSVLAAGTTVTTDIVTTGGTITAGTTLSSDVTVSQTATLTADMYAKSGSVFSDQVTFKNGSYVGADVTVSGTFSLQNRMTLLAGSVIEQNNGTSIKVGSVVGGDVTLSNNVTVAADMTLKAGSVLEDAGTSFKKGTTIGGTYTLSTNDLTIGGDMTIAAGSVLAEGTVLKAGTVLTDDIWVTGGKLLKAGTVLQGDAVTSGTNYLDYALTLKSGSVLNSGSVLAPTATSSSGASATTTLSDIEKYRLSDIDVTSQEAAQVAISIVDSALAAINKIKSDLGSTQNQLTSTIANLTTTQVNVTAAESQIRDVDFAEESSNFSKMQVLMQAGTFALAQANAASQNVLQLLQ